MCARVLRPLAMRWALAAEAWDCDAACEGDATRLENGLHCRVSCSCFTSSIIECYIAGIKAADACVYGCP